MTAESVIAPNWLPWYRRATARTDYLFGLAADKSEECLFRNTWNELSFWA
jgi:hypothetical protein